MTLSGHTGAVTRWEKRVNAGGWANIVNNTTTYSEVPASAGTWDYRALVTSGTCAAVYSANGFYISRYWLILISEHSSQRF